jgi:uncharacterized protein YbjT (DUF2867 family)
MSKKIIVVAGATGAQGGGLVRAILEDRSSEFAVRALTRKTDSERARELASLGAEVVAADFDSEADLRNAFEGAYGAYLVTNFWEHFSPAREQAQAHSMARAARDARLEHVLWSTLEDTRIRVPLSDPRMPTLQDKYKVPHFDAKGEANQFFSDLEVPTTFFYTSFYWDNLISFGMGPKKGPDGKLAFTLPMADKMLPGIAVADIGKCAYGVFKRGAEYIGKSVGVAGEHLTGAQMSDELAKALGQDVVYNAVTAETYRGFGFPGADDLGNMFQYKAEFEAEFCGARDVGVSRALNPELQTFGQWLEANKSRIPLD